MAEIFSNRPGLDAYARTFVNCIPGKDDLTVCKGYLYCLYLAGDRVLTKAIASLRNVLEHPLIVPKNYLVHSSEMLLLG